MTGGHEAVKAALVARLREQVPGRLDEPTVDHAPPWIGAGDALPEAEDRWPCVLVQTTRMTRKLEVEAGAPGEMVCYYDVEIAVAARSVIGDRDDALLDAGRLRDRLLLAVRHTLHWSPGLVPGAMRVANQPFNEDTGASVLDPKGRAIAIGSLKLGVQYVEQTPPPPDVTIPPVIAAGIDVYAVDASVDPLTRQGVQI